MRNAQWWIDDCKYTGTPADSQGRASCGEGGRGSAIFLHCFGPQKPWTGGCVAVPKDIMLRVMRSVRPDCVVVIDTFENLGASW